MKSTALCLCVFLSLLVPRNLQAQNVQDLLARIERLERRVAELEGKPAEAVKPATPTHEEATHTPAVDAAAQPEFPSLHIAGFSDVNFSGTDQPGARSGFTEGQFTLHFSS